MPLIEMVVQRAGQTQHGFKDLEVAAEEIQHELGAVEAKALALKLLEADLAQARCVAVFVLGANAALDQQCLQILGEQAGRDTDWRVQELLRRLLIAIAQMLVTKPRFRSLRLGSKIHPPMFDVR